MRRRKKGGDENVHEELQKIKRVNKSISEPQIHRSTHTDTHTHRHTYPHRHRPAYTRTHVRPYRLVRMEWWLTEGVGERAPAPVSMSRWRRVEVRMRVMWMGWVGVAPAVAPALPWVADATTLADGSGRGRERACSPSLDIMVTTLSAV